jgi:hypothetical protein
MTLYYAGLSRSNLGQPGVRRTRGNCPQILRRKVTKEQLIAMKSYFKSVVTMSLLLTSFVLSACSGPVGSGTGGAGGGGGALVLSLLVELSAAWRRADP